MPKIPALVLLAAFAARPIAAADPQAPIVLGDLGKKLDSALLAAVPPTFWGTVLVAKEGEIVYARCWGAADYQKQPIGLDTLFELASTSKQVTATAILRLEQQGKLKTSDTLDKVFRGLPEDKKKVTIQHLLTHTAGLRDDLGVPYDSPISRPDYIRQMLAPALAAEPGTKFAYSNVGYALLAALVEEVTGKTFEDYVRKELFGPAGLRNSGFINEARLARNVNVTKRRTPERSDWTAARWHWGWGYKGMGGVVTTALDVLAWDQALRTEKVLGAAAREKLVTPALEGYACGWKVETTERGTRRAHHSGGVAGYRVEVSRWVEEDALVVVLTNDENDPFAAEGAILPLLFPAEPLEARLDISTLATNAHGAAIVDTGVSLRGARGKTGLRLLVTAAQHEFAELRMTRGHVRKLIGDLEQVLQGHPADNEEPAIEAGVYLGPYRTQTIELKDALTLEVRPRYEGRKEDGTPVVDERPLLLLIDGNRRAWPLMVKMNARACRDLLAVLRDLLLAAKPAPR